MSLIDLLINKKALVAKIVKELNKSRIFPDPDPWLSEPELTPAAIKSVLDSGSNIDIQNMIDTFLRIDPDFLGKYQDRLSVSRKAKVSWIPASDEAADVAFCEEVKEALNPLLTNKLIKHHLKSNFRRFSVSEITWEPEGGRLIPTEIKPLPTRSFALSTASDDEENRREMKIMIYDSSEDAFYDIPPAKTIQTMSQFELDHSVISLGEALARIIIIKFFCMNKQWPRFNELFSIPPTIVQADANIGDDEFAALQTAVEEMGSNLKGVLKGATDIKFPQPSDGSPDKFVKLSQACKDAIYLAIIGQPATSSSGKDATYASMKILYGIREDIITDDLDMVSDAFNTNLIAPYVFLNYGVEKKAPTIELLIPSQTSDLMDNDKKLKELGVKFSKDYLIKRYDLNEEDFEIEENSKPAAPPAFWSAADLYKIRMLNEWERATDFLPSGITQPPDPSI